MKCPNCGVDFEPKRRGQKFCRDRCQREWNRRNRPKEPRDERIYIDYSKFKALKRTVRTCFV